MNWGVVLPYIKGERGFLPGKYHIHSDVDIIFTVITRLQLRKLKNLVTEIDPQAFVFAHAIKEASGGIMKRQHTHELLRYIYRK